MRTLFLGLAFLLAALPAAAHVGGEFFEQQVGGYLVDVGYTTRTPSLEESVAFDFQLLADGEPADFTDVWVRIEDGRGAAVFAGGLHNATFGGTRMSYRFPASGDYVVNVRYERGDDALAEAAFPMSVRAAARPDYPLAFLGGVLAAVLGYLVLRLLGRRK